MNHSQLGSQIVSDDNIREPRSITGLCLKCSKKNPTLDVKSTLSLLFDGHNVSNFFRPSSSWVKIIGWFSVITHYYPLGSLIRSPVSEASSRSLVQQTGKRASFSCGSSTNFGTIPHMDGEKCGCSHRAIQLFRGISSVNLLHSYWKWAIKIVHLPIKDRYFPWLC